ncbi:MAG: D-alanyl-D-alanine carboxypeptidase/D-alanyl-D-alanine endopeptidase [Nocardioidaceae bacterium]
MNAQSRGGRGLRRWSASLVVLVLVAAVASYLFDIGPRYLGLNYPSPITHPLEVPPPLGLTLPSAKAPEPVASTTPAKDVDPAAVRRALRRFVHDNRLGPKVSVGVAQLSDGSVVYRHGPDLVTPASTMKLLTTTAALAALGPDRRFTTQVVSRLGSKQITLVGGGDPLLVSRPLNGGSKVAAYPARADLDTLARATARALRKVGRSRVRLMYDASLFTGPSVNPHWPASYISENVVSPISALWVDEGRVRHDRIDRVADPARVAAEAFAKALERHKITVTGALREVTPVDQATSIAAVRSAPLREIVQHILEVSDNEGAEVLARQVAIAEGVPATFAGAVQAVRQVLAGLGVDTSGDRMYDGSGLSRQDRLHVSTLLSVIETASSPRHPDLRPVVVDLPVAGFTGSLAYRFDSGPAAALGLGRVHAKTGTLSRVSALAGTVTSADGTVMAFVFDADAFAKPHTLAVRALLDKMAASLAGCACAATDIGTPSASPATR